MLTNQRRVNLFKDNEEQLRQKYNNFVKDIKARPYVWGKRFINILVLIPIVSWGAYFIGDCGFVLIYTSLTIDGLLSFYGTFLAFLGTVALGALALWQNKNIYNRNKEHERIMSAKENYVLFDFSYYNSKYISLSNNKDTKVEKIDFNGKKAFWNYQSLDINDTKLHIEFDIINIGKFPAVDIRFTDEDGAKIEDTNILHGERQDGNTSVENDKTYIVNGCKGVAIINIDLNNLNSKKELKYKLKFLNPFGDEFSQNVIISMNNTKQLIQIDFQCMLEL